MSETAENPCANPYPFDAWWDDPDLDSAVARDAWNAALDWFSQEIRPQLVDPFARALVEQTVRRGPGEL